ncbi:hypothetical protein [Kitasatospora sp. NPDC056531]
MVAGESADPRAVTLTGLAGGQAEARGNAAHWLHRAGAQLAASTAPR